jgi:hypothetical protein
MKSLFCQLAEFNQEKEKETPNSLGNNFFSLISSNGDKVLAPQEGMMIVPPPARPFP